MNPYKEALEELYRLYNAPPTELLSKEDEQKLNRDKRAAWQEAQRLLSTPSIQVSEGVIIEILKQHQRPFNVTGDEDHTTFQLAVGKGDYADVARDIMNHMEGK